MIRYRSETKTPHRNLSNLQVTDTENTEEEVNQVQGMILRYVHGAECLRSTSKQKYQREKSETTEEKNIQYLDI